MRSKSAAIPGRRLGRSTIKRYSEAPAGRDTGALASVPACKSPQSRIFAIALALAVALLLAAPARGGAVELPSGFEADTLDIPRYTEPGEDWITGLQNPTAVDFASDGRMFVAEKYGRIKTFSSVSDQTPTLTADLTRDVQARFDRGLLGMKLDPDYPAQPYIYVSYTYDAPVGGTAPSPPPNTHNADGSDVCNEFPPDYTQCIASGRVARIRLDPATGVASNGSADQPLNPPQALLVSNWCQQFNSHSIGDLEFDSSGMLLIGGGDGASFGTADYGQFGNPCADPANEGGALRSQDWRTAGDPLGYSGAIIRVDPHATPADPTQTNPAAVLAYGLRNPFRFEIRPGTTELYIGDVGWNTWEEIDAATTSLAPGQQPLNFGWPCYEGSAVQPEYSALGQAHAPLCQSLYALGAGAVTNPVFSYVHEQPVAGSGDICQVDQGSALAGLAFYQPALAPPGRVFPPDYAGALFIVDAARGCIWTMQPGPGGAPNPATIAPFASHPDQEVFTPVDITQGPDGALYVPNIWDDSIMRIRYFEPVAALSADRDHGPLPLQVHFDASGSADPAGQGLHYAWDLNGDGQFNEGSDQPTATATYTDPANVTAGVRVTDISGDSDTESLTVYPGDLGPPVPSIDSPAPTLQWTVGDTIPYSGHATDPDGDSPRLDWEILIRHCPSACHTHQLGTNPNTSSGQVVAPLHEDPSHLQLRLTATDSRGMSTTATRDLYPRRVTVMLISEPAGIPLAFGGQTVAAPFETTIPAGGEANVAAPVSAVVRGTRYRFDGWSDGGEPAHGISPREDLALVAHYSGPLARVRLRSRPEGIRVRIGPLRRRAPFTDMLPAGSTRTLLAPRRVKHDGRTWLFRRWSTGGPRRQKITVGEDPGFTAIYRVKPR